MAAEHFQHRITVAALIERDGRLLLVEERDAGRVVFNQPAGHLERGETLTQAVRREVREETGLDCQAEALVGVYLWSAPDGRTVLRFAFACATDGAGQSAADPDIIAVHWLKRAALDRLPLRSPLVTLSADDYLSGRRFPLELLASVLPEP